MKPILFNTEMVQAILEGRKTVTRRKIKLDLGLADTDKNDKNYLKIPDYQGNCHDAVDYCRYQVGDVLYVRETWQDGNFLEDDRGEIVQYIYKADDTKTSNSYSDWGIKWRPSIHMPKAAARMFLKVIDVKCERLQDITENEARKEGCITFSDKINNINYKNTTIFDLTAKDAFISLWDSTIKKDDLFRYDWNANPWVYVIEFEVMKEGGGRNKNEIKNKTALL